MFELSVSPEVVEALRQEAGDVDAVGRGEPHLGVEFLIHEGILDECLTVVEHAVHLKSCYVLPERRELALLYGADLSFRVEHIDVDAFHAKKAVGNSRTRVAARGNEDIN